MRRVSLLITACFLFGLAGLERLVLAPRWMQRLPVGWRWEANFIGTAGAADEKTGQFPEKDPINIYDRQMQIVDESARPDAVLMEDRYTQYDRESRKIVWEYITVERVDPRTGAHLAPEHQGAVAVFPRCTQKQAYVLRSNYLKGITLAYEREEDVEGMATYVFGHKGRGEYTESYGGSPDYPGVKVEAGQEIKCADDQFKIRVWVEPVTGEIVKLEEASPSGDWVCEIATGKKLKPVMRWAGITAGDDVARRADLIRFERLRLLWAGRYLPWLLFGLGLACLAGSWWSGRRAIVPTDLVSGSPAE